MHLYSALIYNSDYTLLYKNFNLSEFYFFMRSKIETAIVTISDSIVRSKHQNKFYQVTEQIEDKIFHIYIYTNTKCYIALTDEQYPQLVIMEFFNEMKDINNTPNLGQLDNIWAKYQDPISVNKILQVKKQLELTKNTMLESIDKIIERGDKIEDLVDKTDHLNDSAIKFMNNAKQLNSCCVIL